MDTAWIMEILKLTLRARNPFYIARLIWQIARWLQAWRDWAKGYQNLNGWQLCGKCPQLPPKPLGYAGAYQTYSSGNVPCLSAKVCQESAITPMVWGSPIPNTATFLQKRLRYLPNNSAIITEEYNRTQTGPAFHPYFGNDTDIYPRRWPETWPKIRDGKRLVTPIVPEHWPRTPQPPQTDPPEVKRPRPSPNVDRQVIITPGVGGSSDTRVATRPALRRPPRANEREKKLQGASNTIQNILKYAAKGKEALSEVKDFVESIYDALPKSVQDKNKGRKTPQAMTQAIYDNWDKIDWKKAIDNMIQNEVEDRLMGAAIRQSDKASRARGDSANLQGRGAWMPRYRGPS